MGGLVGVYLCVLWVLFQCKPNQRTSACILQTLCDDSTDWPKNVTREQQGCLRGDFAYSQPYLSVLVIGLSCLLCPQPGLFCLFLALFFLLNNSDLSPTLMCTEEFTLLCLLYQW
ncbi:hypothetical protein GOODEAATRI_011689 [Goodea atripinnis]|uniref:Uncharacterized protein n=1 Tax=Goodea atripinnis TaxID=208336 RepID=A0ABV0NJF4_9TELE